MFERLLNYFRIRRLAKLLRSRSVDERRLAIRALAQYSTRQAATAIILVFGDIDSEVRETAYKTLRRIGAPAVLPLQTLLEPGHDRVEVRAAELLGDIGCPDAVPALLNAVFHGDKFLAKAAARALARIDDRRAADGLAKAWREDLYGLNIEFAGILHGLGWKSPDPKERAQLACQVGLFDEAASEGAAAIEALLGWLSNPRVAEILLGMSQSIKVPPNVVAKAHEALKQAAVHKAEWEKQAACPHAWSTWRCVDTPPGGYWSEEDSYHRLMSIAKDGLTYKRTCRICGLDDFGVSYVEGQAPQRDSD